MKIRILFVLIAVILVSSLSFAQDGLREFLEGSKGTFNTENHPKAKGAHFRVSYPLSWKALEGERPNIVQKFVSEEGRGLELAMIITQSLQLPPGIAFTNADIEEFFSSGGMKEMLPEEARFIDSKQTKIEGIPAGILEYSTRQERAGFAIDMQILAYIFIHRSTMVQFQCQVAGMADSQTDISSRMDQFRPLFTVMANSIVVPDIWVGAPGNVENQVSSNSLPYIDNQSLAETLVISLLVTWGLGLTPPLLTRYVFARRPLSRKTAGWLAAGFSAFFWLGFIALKSSLGEKPGTGAVWVIMFFVARWIMSRGHISDHQKEDQRIPTKMD